MFDHLSGFFYKTSPFFSTFCANFPVSVVFVADTPVFYIEWLFITVGNTPFRIFSLMIQIAVGTLYMFSVPRGYTDGFNQWIKQVIALCLTAFMQTTLLYLGLLTFSTDMLLALGIIMAANEVPRIAQQFGLDSSTKVNVMSVVHTTTTAVNLGRALAKAK